MGPRFRGDDNSSGYLHRKDILSDILSKPLFARRHLGVQRQVLAVGLVVASVSAFFAIWGLMRILERFSSWPFVLYRFLLGVVILVGAAVGWFA